MINASTLSSAPFHSPNAKTGEKEKERKEKAVESLNCRHKSGKELRARVLSWTL